MRSTLLSYLLSLSPSRPFLLFIPLFAFVFLLHRRRVRKRRQRKVPPTGERVLILGASSGVGKELALQYARRGAYVCLVSRNEEVEDARQECVEASVMKGGKEGRERVISVVADFSNAEEMVKVRERVQTEWGRLDTLAVIAGVSSLKPLLATVGVESEDTKALPDASLEGVQDALRIASAAMAGNFFGPLTAALVFVTLLSRTSPSPSVLLLSSLAAVTPAPTRALYAASKSASLLLYQTLAIEHPSVRFTIVLPSTIEGNFRASAVDAGTVREADPNKKGLKRGDVARRCILAVDREERDVFMQGFYRVVPMIYYTLCAGLVEWVAKKKYYYP